MNINIVADSSSNIFSFEGINYKSVPLKIISGAKEYEDLPGLDIPGMIRDMHESKEKFTTSCPNTYDWEKAFEGEDNIIALTITSKLSGSYTAATAAAQQFKKENPDKNIFVLDTLSVGPETQLIIEKIREIAANESSFDNIVKEINEYSKKTNLLFSLQSLNNLAKNGRVSFAVAKIAGVLGIRLVGMADDGNLKLIHKCRGERKTIETLKSSMLDLGFKGGKLRISNCENPESANQLKSLILADYPKCDIEINKCTALCSFYAEEGGLLVGFES